MTHIMTHIMTNLIMINYDFSTVSAVTSGVVMSPANSTVVSMANAQRPVVTMAQHPGSSQQFVLNTSGVITGASQAPLLLTGKFLRFTLQKKK